jgi:hypothetical protein
MTSQNPESFQERFEQSQPMPPRAAASVKTETVKVSRDKAQYVRHQKGHSLTMHLLFGVVVLWIPAIYYSVSPNHYWHA